MSDTLSGDVEDHRPDAADTSSAPTALVSGPIGPDSAGWAQTAMAIRGVRRLPTPVMLALRVEGVGTVTIDSARHCYTGDVTPDAFPVSPRAVLVETWASPPGVRSDSAPPGNDLDGLLWRIGYHGFGDDPAYWLWPGERYRLLRWPNIASLDVDADELRVIALLTNGSFTQNELATSLGCEISTVHRVINALSLIGILDNTADEQEPAVTAPALGLFQRLRKRLGF